MLQGQSRTKMMGRLPSSQKLDDDSPGHGLAISPAGFKPRRALIAGPAVTPEGLGQMANCGAGAAVADDEDLNTPPPQQKRHGQLALPPMLPPPMVPPLAVVGPEFVQPTVGKERPSSESIEEAAFKALADRTITRAKAKATKAETKAKAKASAKASAKAAAKTDATGTGKPTCALKRPAAAVVEEVLSDGWAPADGDKEKRLFQSKMFHRVTKLCKHNGIDDEEQIKAAGSTAFKQAGDIWANNGSVE
jgi:hypothetical protein